MTMGKGITGAVNYARGEGRDPVTREFKKLAPGEESRVEFFGGGNFGFSITNGDDIELARKVMEYEAMNQRGKSRQVVGHLSLAWRPGEEPTREHMQEQVESSLAAIGMGNARYLYFSHGDEDYAHVHAIILNINPDTGYRYNLKGNYLKLSTWAQAYEAEHGGIISLRRAINNELRAAIDARDAGAVLENLTKQRPTVTEAQIDTALAKQIKDQDQRREFVAQILSHHTVLGLSEKPGDHVTRYTTRAVWEAEQHVRRASESLHNDRTHGVDDRHRAAILKDERFRGITEEQARAFRHVTGPEGLALIDGQAGTGKSYTIAAVREAYEAAGCKVVVGLGPTNAVAEDMRADGFSHSATIHSELFALNNARRTWDAKTVVIVDEAAMIDTKLMAMVTAWADDRRVKLILVGDDRQLSSIDHGGMFGKLKDDYSAAALSEVKRQYKHDERRASEMMAEGNFHDALHIYDAKGSIHWTRTQKEAGEALIRQWAKDSAEAPGKTRFVLAVTNEDVDRLNGALRGIREQRGELGKGHEIETAHGRFAFAVGDRLQFTGTDNKQGIKNGRAGTIIALDGTHLAVTLDGPKNKAKTINFDAANFAKFRHGYAGTVYKAQGKTLDQTYLYHSEHWRSAPSYVALTRHREKTELFVATNTAKDLRELARQMARTDERRAASMFHPAERIDVPTLTAPEILARFSADAAPRKDETMQTPVPPQEPPKNPRLDEAEDPHPTPQQQEAMSTTNLGKTLPNSAVDTPATAAAAKVTGNLAEAEPDDRSLTREFVERGIWDAPANTNRVERVALVAEAAPQAPAPEPAAALREAWQQPAFSYATIKHDAWTAVYLAAPENASQPLLAAAYDAAGRCLEFLDKGGRDYADAVTHGPLIPQGNEAEVRARAEARRDQLHAMMYLIGAPAAEAPRRERIAALEGEARAAAAEIVQAAPEPASEPARNDLVRSFRPAEPQPGRYDELRLEIASEARREPEAPTAPIAQPEAERPALGPQGVAPPPISIASAQPEIPAETSAERAEEPPPNWKGRPDHAAPLRGARFFLESIGHRIADVFEFLHDIVSPPTPPSAAEIHHRLQHSARGGNLEAQAAEAAAAEAQENTAAHDWLQHEASRAQNEQNLSLAQRFGTPPTSEANLSRGVTAEHEQDYEPD
jgi:hypothetical protein